MYNAPANAAQGSGSIVGLGSIGNVLHPPSSSIDAAIESLTSLNGRLHEQVSRARSIADAYFGAAPEQCGSGQVPSDPASKSEALSRRVKDLQEILNSLSVQLDRLTCI